MIKLIVAIIIITIILLVYLSKYDRNETLIIKPDDDKIPIIKMLKSGFWAEEGEPPMKIELLTDRKLRWYGLIETDLEMHYELVDPFTINIFGPGLDDYYKAPGLYRITVVDDNTLKMTIQSGLAISAPLYLKRVNVDSIFLKLNNMST